MNKKILLLLLVGFSLMVGCNHPQKNQKADTKNLESGQRPAVLAREVLMELDYFIYLPEGYDQKQEAWPLMVFLHGAGERGHDLNKVKVHGPPKLVDQGKDLPFIIVSPQCPTDQWWPNKIGHIMALIDETVEHYSVDESRIYLTGLSMGGYGTWAIASAHSERFAAIAPVCGGGLPYMARNLKDIPIWAFHGAKDPVVPLEQSQQMVDAVKWAGGNAKLTVYPEADHDSWTQTYDNAELYEWLLSHSKKQD
jgi:predicted peptidase